MVPPLVAFGISFFTSMGGVSGAFLLLPFQMSVLGFTGPSVTSTNFLFNVTGTPGGVSVWYRWTAPMDGFVSVDTVGSDFDTLLAVDGRRSVESFHKALGQIMWEHCGMARDKAGLEAALEKIPRSLVEASKDLGVGPWRGALDGTRLGGDALHFGLVMDCGFTHRSPIPSSFSSR